MEQHPVPQNVTTFQFRLIGDMTIRQFGYLLGGIIAGYVCSKLPLPFFFSWPLAIGSGLIGFGLAFVPIEERPMDVWVASFFKNIYSPTQWVWQKRAPQIVPLRQADALPTQEAPKAPRMSPPVAAPRPPTQRMPGAPLSPVQPLVSRGGDPLAWLKKIFQNKPGRAASLPPGLELTNAFARVQTPPVTPPSALRPPQAAPAPPPVASKPVIQTPPHEPFASQGKRVVELQGQLSQALRDRERLEKELIAMRQHAQQQVRAAPPAPARQASVAPASPASTTSVRVIAPGAAARAGLPRLTTFPNVVTGIVKDQYGNLLAGMLITVRDKEDVPLRALKTNKLGQFAASTPLPNDTYIVEIEDPRGAFVFDKAQMSLTGVVAPPIEVTAKSQKQVERDKLAKEIFGNQPM